MKKILFFLLATMLLYPCGMNAQMVDSVDVLDYDLTLDLSQESPFHGEELITMQLLRQCDSVDFQLIGTIDSVEVNGVRQLEIVKRGSVFTLPTAGIAAGQTFMVHVWYHASHWVENYGWGGFHFDSDMSYNLGVGFDTDPHVVGRAMFLCRDNFTDKATYTLRVKTKAGWTAECGGICQSVVTNDDGTESSVWRIDNPTPTYLVSVSQSDWKRVHDTIHSLYGDYPLTIGHHKPNDNTVVRAFAELDSVVPMFERCFGPYRWGRIGYIATEKGSMEHVNNIALDLRFIASTQEIAQTTIAHELGHAWFGNLVTCEEEGDMWINEGGASFSSEVAREAVKGRQTSDDYYQRKLESVLRTTHITDDGYRALHGMPHNYTYGSTTYEKGWMVWHSLRGYLGEELFYASLKQLMERCAFGTLNAWQVRDSLSLYTGVDLTDFFDFHVFSPGFVDYRLEYLGNYGFEGNSFHICQQTVGTTQTLASHRVPVTIFYYNDDNVLDSTKRWVEFDGSETLFNIGNIDDLGFDPAFCVLDRDCEISDAAIVNGAQLEGFGSLQTMPLAHLKVRSYDTLELYPKYLYAEHHFAPAMGEMPGGVMRKANRYWVLRGSWVESDSVKGYFRFVRTGYTTGSYTNLDCGFYSNVATADSLGLFYRRNSEHPWSLVSRVREGDNNEGWLVAENIMPGEYTLAVVDFEHLGVQPSHPTFHSPLSLFPNPLHPGQPLTIEIGADTPFTVSIFDVEGRLVWQKKDCHSGQELSPSLTNGTYFVLIENNFISLHSKLIQL